MMKRITALISALFLLQYTHAQTTEHVSLVYDIQAGTGSADPAHLTVFNNKLYFSANNGVVGRELWVYNGIDSPVIVANINAGSAHGAGSWSWTAHNAVIGNKMYYQGNNGSSGWELFSCDTASNISLAADINTGPNDSNPFSYVAYNNLLYFFATTPAYGYELWQYDPSTATATRLSDIRAGMANGIAAPDEPITAFNGKLYFAATDSVHGEELFSYNPANGNIALVSDINADTAASAPRSLITDGNRLYFSAKTVVNGRELYVYNGTGTPVRITDNIAGSPDGVYPVPMTWYDSALIFAGANAASGWEPYRYDTTTQQVTLIADLYPGISSSGPGQFTVLDSVLCFSAMHPAAGQELWRYNGHNPPAMVQDIYAGPDGSYPVCLTVFNQKLYMNARAIGTGYELFVLDTTTANPTSILPVLKQAHATVYPNPVQNECYARLVAAGLFSITDITGRKIMQRTLPQGITTIDMSGYAPGIYLWQVQQQNGAVEQGKIIRD